MSRIHRSLLFVPAANSRMLAKAFASEADGVILDLEDSVANAEKPAAREAVAMVLAGSRALPTFVRVNAASTPHLLADLQATMRVAPDAVIVPKVESAEELKQVDWLLGQIEAQSGHPGDAVALMPIIETACGLAAAVEIARASARVRRLSFGAVDLARDMDFVVDDESGPMAHARFAVAVASRAAGLQPPLDSVFTAYGDPDGLRNSAMQARAFGYGGKGCIHPAQIAVVNAVFTPSDAELDRARRIVEAFAAAERSGRAAIAVDGIMVDYPVAEKARALLRDHGAV